MPKNLPSPMVQSKDTGNRMSRVVSSRIVNARENIEGAEETEITAQISVPQEGGWGWVVVLCAFWCIFILDGVSFTFGSMYADITADLAASESLVGFVNSIAMALYFMSAPLASAFINRFGFRACAMTGSIICSSTLFFSYFVTSIPMLCVSYGFVAGIGYSFINMGSSLVVGFYFERLRSIALAIATTGSSAGIMIMFPFNTYIVRLGGWRIATLIHSGLFGMVYYLSMAYKPLLSFTINMKTSDEATRTVTYLPSLATSMVRAAPSRVKTEGLTSTATERLFSAVSNIHYPTAAEVVEEVVPSTTQPGPSRGSESRITLKAYNPQGGFSQRQLKQVKSIMSKSTVQEKVKTIEVAQQKPPRKRKCWARLCHWEEHIEESRPMYRDDAFYDGRIDKLPIYQKSVINTAEEARTGLEYQMAVSRAVTTADLKEKRGVFTTAARRILVTMMDPKLLERCSFRLLCISGFFLFVGFLVPYLFIQDRNLSKGMDPTYCNLCVSVIGFSNIVGKIVVGVLACKLNPIRLYCLSCIMSGIATMLSNLSFTVYFQYAYCITFGFSVASLACLRSVLIVKLYGLEKLTNATGIILTFMGLGSLLSTPLASMLKNNFGYSVAFCVSGITSCIAGVVLIPIPSLCKKENDKIINKPKRTDNKNVPSANNPAIERTNNKKAYKFSEN